ncbi:MAG: alpha/beta fold hydrolase [Myxococcota bacterium]|nr:alpha/beta fold hydrolase [Myxococcota bacterium]
MRRIEMAGLHVSVAGGHDGEGGGDGPAVVLMHGFGAPGDNLVSLWRVLASPPGTRWLFPAAPLLLQSAPVEARAWWMLDRERLLTLARHGGGDELVRQVPLGLSEARERVLALLDEVDQRLHPSKIVLGGFSQGAMLACDVALRTKHPVAGMVLLSGAPIAIDEWASVAPKRAGLPTFQSHGQTDSVLPFAYAETLRDLLRDAGLDVTWVPFPWGHEIPPSVADALGRWLLSVLA